MLSGCIQLQQTKPKKIEPKPTFSKFLYITVPKYSEIPIKDNKIKLTFLVTNRGRLPINFTIVSPQISYTPQPKTVFPDKTEAFYYEIDKSKLAGNTTADFYIVYYSPFYIYGKRTGIISEIPIEEKNNIIKITMPQDKVYNVTLFMKGCQLNTGAIENSNNDNFYNLTVFKEWSLYCKPNKIVLGAFVNSYKIYSLKIRCLTSCSANILYALSYFESTMEENLYNYISYLANKLGLTTSQ